MASVASLAGDPAQTPDQSQPKLTPSPGIWLTGTGRRDRDSRRPSFERTTTHDVTLQVTPHGGRSWPLPRLAVQYFRGLPEISGSSGRISLRPQAASPQPQVAMLRVRVPGLSR